MTQELARHLAAGFACFALVLPPASAASSTLSDLKGVRASAAENTIRSRGFHAHHTAPTAGGRYTYWWNDGTTTCVRTLTSDGIISNTRAVDATDCGYYGESNSEQSGSGKSLAAVAAVAAAIIGVAALTHKSHHRDDQAYSDPDALADFERGHRDGLYNHSYNNYSRSDAYSNGYQSGVNERDQQSSYRGNRYAGNPGGQSYAGGYNQPADYSDLVGARAAGVDSDLQSRGFRGVDSFQSGNGKISIWWNSRTRQCLQLITVDGRADSITDIQTHQRCR